MEALLGNEEKVFSGIPSIEKKITEKVREFLSFKLFDNQFLTQKNVKHFIDISIVSKGEDFL